MDILGVVYSIFCGLSESFLIVWSEAESYIQLASSTMIVLQVIYHNIVFNHNYGYLFQMRFCCR